MTLPATLATRRGSSIVPALLLLGTVACGRGAATATMGASPAADSVTIDVVRVVEQPLNVPLSLPAELAPYQSVAIYAKVTGFVKTMRVDRGSRVRAGDLIATLEAPELLAQRSQAQSKLQEAEAQLAATRSKADADCSTYDRLKAASATPGVVAGNDVLIAEKAAEASQNQVVAGQQRVEVARQEMNASRDLERYLLVTAPFEGVVTERGVHPGALVGPASGPDAAVPMVRLVQNSRLRLVIPVPEAYTAAIRAGTTIPFSVAAYPDRTWSGTVARIAQAVDVTTRTMAVELDVPNTDGRLAPGTFCQVRWPVRRSGPSLFVPSGSVASTTARTFVVRIRNCKTEWVDVKTGLTSGPLVEVFGDLRSGDAIAGRGTDEVGPGTEVRTKETKPPTS